MIKTIKYIAAAVAAFHAFSVQAALQMPNYASSGGNLQSDLERTGGNITKLLLFVTVMVGIGGIIYAGMAFASGDGETGKMRLRNAVIGLIVAAVATGIAALATGT